MGRSRPGLRGENDAATPLSGFDELRNFRHSRATNRKSDTGDPKRVSELRQQILILHLDNSDLDARTVAWALYDGAAPESQLQMQSGDQDAPPYTSVLAAMRDGWFVLQVPTLPHYVRGQEHEVGHLPYEYVLERKVEKNG